MGWGGVEWCAILIDGESGQSAGWLQQYHSIAVSVSMPCVACSRYGTRISACMERLGTESEHRTTVPHPLCAFGRLWDWGRWLHLVQHNAFPVSHIARLRRCCV